MATSVPNTLAVAQCRQVITYYAEIKLSDIDVAVLKTDLGKLVKYLANTDQAINSALAKTDGTLKTSEIKQLLANLEGSESELETSMSELKHAVQNLRDEMEIPRYNLETMKYTENGGRLDIYKNEIEGLHSMTKETGVGEYDVLLAYERQLGETIKAYQEESIYDKLQPIINDLDDKAKSSDSPAEFKMKMIKGSVGLVNKMLKIADGEVKYDDLVKARADLIKQLSVFEKRNEDTDKRLKENYDKIARIQDFESLRAPKKQYADEAKKIVSTYDSFIESVFAETLSFEEQAKNFVAKAPQLVNYAASLVQKWSRTH